MIPVTVINLAGEAARWRAAAGALERVGIRAARLDAVDGSVLHPATRSALYDAAGNARAYHKPLCDGEIGCYASHLEAWRRLVASGRGAAAILEDDVDVDPDLAAVLGAIERLDVPWDMVKLVGRARERVRGRMPLSRGRDLIDYRRVPSLTGAYAVTRQGALKLLARRRPFGRPVDVDLRHWWECDLRVLGLDPYPVRPSPAARRSTIAGRCKPIDAAARWHRLGLQATYSWHNWLATRAAPTLTQPRAAPGRAARAVDASS